MGKKEILRTAETEFPVILQLNPKRLTNSGQLFTTQKFIDLKKLKRALSGDFQDSSLPKAYYWQERKAIVLGDGNHRTAVAYLRNEEINVEIIGLFDGKKIAIPFNVFIRKHLSGMGLEY